MKRFVKKLEREVRRVADQVTNETERVVEKVEAIDSRLATSNERKESRDILITTKTTIEIINQKLNDLRSSLQKYNNTSALLPPACLPQTSIFHANAMKVEKLLTDATKITTDIDSIIVIIDTNRGLISDRPKDNSDTTRLSADVKKDCETWLQQSKTQKEIFDKHAAEINGIIAEINPLLEEMDSELSIAMGVKQELDRLEAEEKAAAEAKKATAEKQVALEEMKRMQAAEIARRVTALRVEMAASAQDATVPLENKPQELQTHSVKIVQPVGAQPMQPFTPSFSAASADSNGVANGALAKVQATTLPTTQSVTHPANLRLRFTNP